MTPERLEEIEREIEGATGFVRLRQLVRELIPAVREADRAALGHFEANGIAYQLGLEAGKQGALGRPIEPEEPPAPVVQPAPIQYPDWSVSLPSNPAPDPDWSGLRDTDPNVHRRAAERARSDWREGQQAISWCRGRISHLESELRDLSISAHMNLAANLATRAELASSREANVVLASAGSQLLGAMEERDGIMRDYQIEGDENVRGIVERTIAAACGLRDELDGARFSLAKLTSSLPRCQACPNAATYSWHGGDDLACDDHVPAIRSEATGFELPYASILRALGGLSLEEIERLIETDKAAEREYARTGGRE